MNRRIPIPRFTVTKARVTGKQRETASKILAEAYIFICCPNDAAISMLIDAIAALKKTPLWKQKIKQAANNTQRAADNYQRTLDCHLREFSNWQFWLDYADCFADIVKPHVTNLRIAVKQYLDDRKTEDSETLALVFTASIMLQIAAKTFRYYFECMKDTHGIDASPAFRAADLTGVYRQWEVLTDILTALPKWRDADDGIQHNERVQLAVDVLCRKFSNPKIANMAGEKALLMNPELIPEGWEPKEWEDEP